ncbi:PAP2 superfamily protein [Sphingopyxis sp. YR583]|uniref:phosphatase PAP2 family protein n=1 Tax=Sphingopyxis sp. YR583 TaxID=1881047 RepID=UPI0008A7F144|nr:phosphatase PAP2 family protein [Sphingopyxis sp. YR583]SEH19724.1 PAP2 superfamily protein [Sphingopyxis sp. YR583]
MRSSLRAIPPEIVIAGASLAVMFLLSVAFNLPIVLPSGNRAAFVGVHYLYPLIGVALLGVATFAAGKRDVSASFFIALPCYIAILFAHFHIKLWIPHINPALYDDFYWQTDQMVRPIVDACIYIRKNLFGLVTYESNFYMLSFIGLFYTSFLYHAMKTPAHFRTLVVAVLLVQSLGAIAYLVAPAVGPFIYERGIDPFVTPGQLGMLDFYRSSVAGGSEWLAERGGTDFTAGLAAMPSLHAAGAFLFFLFAWKHGRILLPLYSIILFFILVTSIATRWHYVIDVPVGIALAWGCLWLAERIVPVEKVETVEPTGDAVPAVA